MNSLVVVWVSQTSKLNSSKARQIINNKAEGFLQCIKSLWFARENGGDLDGYSICIFLAIVSPAGHSQ